MKFTSDHKLKPYLYISAANCIADSITWSYKGLKVNRKAGFADLMNKSVRINKDFLKCFIHDTSYIWLLFNDCTTGRGYYLKLPFDKSSEIGRSNRALNSFDPKFSIADNLVAYSDRGNIFVEDMATGKTGQLTFGKAIEIDYSALHDFIDSVNISPTRIWAKVKIDNGWKELEETINLK
jgi:hypothetical protein